MLRSCVLLAGVVAVAVDVGAQQPRGREPPSCRLIARGVAAGIRVAGDADFEAHARDVCAQLRAGRWSIRFAASGGGRPEPVDVDVPEGASVQVANGAPPAPDERPLATAAVVDGAHRFESVARSDFRIRARVATEGAGAARGLVARWQGEGDHYRLLWDPAAGKLRLERVLGGSVLVLHECAAPEDAAAREWLDLELEVEGFRLVALSDDEPVARVFDGALSSGQCGTTGPADARFAEVLVAPPAARLPTTVVVTEGRRATATVRFPDAVGGAVAMCLRLDRPTAAWPKDPSGFEPFVLQPLAEPVFGWFATGWIDDDGAFAGSFRWPEGVALGLQAALVGGLVGSPDGSSLRDRLPWSAVRF